MRITSPKAQALIAWLALHAQPQDRDHLASLFWPDSEREAGRQSLRKAYSRLPKNLPIDSTRVSLTWREPEAVDVFDFERANPEDAVAYWRGEFLAEAAADSAEFGEWLLLQREALNRHYRDALSTLTDKAFAEDNFSEALNYSQQLIKVDSYNEAAHRVAMQSLDALGRRPEALAHFERMGRLFSAELGVEPSAETHAVATAIRRDPAVSSTGLTASPPPRATPHAEARAAILYKVQSFWIESVLHQSLHGQAMIEPGKLRQPRALAHPWSSILRRPDQVDTQLPIDTQISDLFDREGRALLILGAPGGGKTTTLLDLAQEMLARADEDAAQPIPVVLSLATWRKQTLADWVVSEINEKYLIPGGISTEWLVNNNLLLLLDGLDEVKRSDQAACIDAINQFRQAHGLTPLAICCRQLDYESLGTQLNLNSAIVLEPISEDDAFQFLGSVGDDKPEIKRLLRENASLRNLAQTPLFLSMLALVIGDGQQGIGTIDTPVTLLDRFVDLMFGRGDGGRFSAEKSRRWLSWLATQMQRDNQPLFLLEKLQPTALASSGMQIIYFALSRLVGAFIFATMLIGDYASLSITVTAAIIFFATFSTTTAHFLATQRQMARDDLAPGRLLTSKRLIIGLSIWLIVTLLMQPLAEAGTIAFTSMMAAVIFGLGLPQAQIRDDIRTVEALAWSWRTFARGMIFWLFVALALLAAWAANLAPLALTIGNMALAFVVIGVIAGLRGRTIPNKTLPNQGMYLSMRNTLIGGMALCIALAVTLSLLKALGLFDILSYQRIVLTSMKYGAVAALWYGGFDLIKHLTLRALLAIADGLPLRTVSFLEHAVKQRILHRAGSGYLFIHPLLRDHFAEASPPMASPSSERLS